MSLIFVNLGTPKGLGYSQHRSDMCALSLNNLHILGYAVSLKALLRYFCHKMTMRSL